jgi:hypothetical protein
MTITTHVRVCCLDTSAWDQELTHLEHVPAAELHDALLHAEV